MKKLSSLKQPLLLIPLCVLSLTFSNGCSTSTDEPVEKSGFYFDTSISITLYDGPKEKETLLAECFSLCSQYEQLFSRTVDGSELDQINKSSGKTITLSDETAELLSKALSYSDLTHGIFDCSIAPLSALWDFHGKDPSVPNVSVLKEALSHVDYRKIHLDGNTVTLEDTEMMLDLGGIAKGYIADLLKEYLKSQGVTSALINLGGNVLTLGNKPDGVPFRIGIQRPFDTSAIASVELSDQTLVTSGVYERYFEEDGVLYHHLLDPATGYPFDNHLYSVTILCDSSADADALSTGCFGLGLEDGMALIEELDGIEALFITDTEELHYSSGFPHKKESRMRDSPPAAGRVSDMLPLRRSAILAERF